MDPTPPVLPIDASQPLGISGYAFADLHDPARLASLYVWAAAELSKARLIDVDADQMKKIVGGDGVYADGKLAKGTFKGHDRDARVIEILNGYIGTSTLDENTAYLIARTFLDNLDNMAEKSPQYRSVIRLVTEAKQKGVKVLEMGAPLHPGSARAFKEAGILK